MFSSPLIQLGNVLVGIVYQLFGGRKTFIDILIGKLWIDVHIQPLTLAQSLFCYLAKVTTVLAAFAFDVAQFQRRHTDCVTHALLSFQVLLAAALPRRETTSTERKRSGYLWSVA